MEATFFDLKRAHQSSLRVSRAVLKRVLTPARFDMLYALHEHDPGRFGILQKKLCEILGVTNATVSRMLKSLDELGYVWREVDEDDCRRRVISLTPSGRALIERLICQIRGSGIAALAIDCALGADRFWSPAHCRRRRRALHRQTLRIRQTFWDVATLDYDAPPPYEPAMTIA